MQKTEVTLVEVAVQQWKDNKVVKCEMEFSCGGDSMNDYEYHFYDSEGKEVEVPAELKDYIEDQSFKRVEFYVNSDGEYLGEFGTVYIELEDNEEDFSFSKEANSEWSERFTEDVFVELNDTEKTFIKEKVSNINGNGYKDYNVNYKIDCIVTEDEKEMLDELYDKIEKVCNEHEFQGENGEPDEDFSFQTNFDGSDEDVIEIKDGELRISLSRSFLVIKESEF